MVCSAVRKTQFSLYWSHLQLLPSSFLLLFCLKPGNLLIICRHLKLFSSAAAVLYCTFPSGFKHTFQPFPAGRQDAISLPLLLLNMNITTVLQRQRTYGQTPSPHAQSHSSWETIVVWGSLTSDEAILVSCSFLARSPFIPHLLFLPLTAALGA